jgi:hypothetical protein
VSACARTRKDLLPFPRALSSSHGPTPLSVRAPTLELHEILQPFAARPTQKPPL